VNGKYCLVPHYLKRDYVRALELLRQANLPGPAFTNGRVGIYLRKRSVRRNAGGIGEGQSERKDDPILIYSTGMVYAARGQRAEALQIIKELALNWLELGLTAGAIGASYKDEPVWDSIRSGPRFAELVRRMGISS